MKKLLLATLLAGFSTLAVANTSSLTSGLYVQGDVGAGRLEAKEDGEKAKDSNAYFRVAVGKDAGLVRYAADYTNYGKIKDAELEAKTQSLGVSATYDFATQSAFTPYVGVRVAANQVRITDHELSEKWKKTKAGVGARAGVQYQVTPNVALDGGVEYNYLGKFEGVKVNQYGVSVGARYNF